MVGLLLETPGCRAEAPSGFIGGGVRLNKDSAFVETSKRSSSSYAGQRLTGVNVLKIKLIRFCLCLSLKTCLAAILQLTQTFFSRSITLQLS